MATLIVEGVGTFEVPDDKRLVLALTDDVGIDQLHACGGKSKCTTCKVTFITGEPQQMTEAEQATLAAKGLNQPGVRLSCQLLCKGSMHIKAESRLAGSTRTDCGTRPGDEIFPEPVWTERS